MTNPSRSWSTRCDRKTTCGQAECDLNGAYGSSQMGLPDNVGKTITAEDESTYCGRPGKGEPSICNGGKTKMI
ncbi:hypothetical protein OYC64_002795 [Pagothenia borchgrevinki]|nr:hypothetical protein CgunFtcFv8_004347 [Champsocephalus gunnari]